MPHIADCYALKSLAYEKIVPAAVGETPQRTVDRYMTEADQADPADGSGDGGGRQRPRARRQQDRSRQAPERDASKNGAGPGDGGGEARGPGQDRSLARHLL